MIDMIDTNKSNNLKHIQKLLYSKSYPLLQSQLLHIQKQLFSQQQQIMLDYIHLKINLSRRFDRQAKGKVDNPTQQIINIKNQYTNKIDPDLLQIHTLAIEGFALQIGQMNTNNTPSQSLDIQSLKQLQKNSDGLNSQRQFIRKISKLPSLQQIFNNQNILKRCRQSSYLAMSILQLWTKKCIRLKRNHLKDQVMLLKKLIEQFNKNHPENLKMTSKLYTIVLHLILHCSSILFSSISEMISHYIELCCEQLEGHNQLMNTQVVIVYLYNVLKIILSFNEIPHSIIPQLERFYRLFDLKSPGKNYSANILQFFFIIKLEIFKSGEEQQNQIDKLLKSQNSPEEVQKDYIVCQLIEKFSDFFNINLDQVIVELNDITRNIVRHKVASLATIINLKLGIRRFSKDFLQIMHDSPFNNDIQTIKLCFELFDFREFQKLQNLLQIILAVPNGRKTNQKEVMIAMCCIFNGLYLQNRQKALLYCKMNHQQYKQSITNKYYQKQQLLKEETFLQHIGFGYYNMASNEAYIQNKNLFYMKALENFLLSYELNKQNYLLNYCISKIYLKFYDYDKAYKFAMQSCKSHRGSWAPFCLLACIYFCQKKLHKSIILIDQLLKKFDDVGVLYYIRAFLEVNKLLMDVENDEQIEAAKILGEEFYWNHYQKILKSKSFHNVIKYCQNYYQLSMNMPISECDQNYFSSINLSSQVFDGQKYLLKIVKLFIQIGQFNQAQHILKYIPVGHIPAIFCKGLLHERRKQYLEAKKEYQNILNLDPCYPQAIIRLAFVTMQQIDKAEKNSQIRDIDVQEQRKKFQEGYKNCLSSLEIASKFTKNDDYVLVKGLLMSRVGQVQQANKILLQDCEQGWTEDLPDLLFYY